MADKRTIENKQAMCCGCEVCASACPVECISMKPDSEGFLYPQVEHEKCISCEKCVEVCPFENYSPPVPSMSIKAYAVQHTDKKRLEQSASGGAYTALAEYILKNNGVVVGAEYNYEEGIIRHTVIEDLEELFRHSSSKYVQSRMTGIYEKVKEILENTGKAVLFSGTPCQVVALKRYLKKPYEKLICVDLVCASVSSSKVFNEYKKLMEAKHNSKIKNLNFKKKTYGYHSSTMTLWFENGVHYSKSRLTDLMMWCFTSHICDRPSCENCVVKGINRYSDLTIFDCWHYSELTGKTDDDRGHTNVLVHSPKGLTIISNCKNLLHCEEIDPSESVKVDGNMVEEHQKSHVKRKQFFDELNRNGLESAIKCCIPITTGNRLKESSKKWLYKLGILERVKRFFK